MHAMYKAFADTAVAQTRRAESHRVSGTHPSLPLEKYVGTYRDTLFGTTTIAMTNGQLTAHAESLNGTLEHWQYDVFRITWTDPFIDPTYVQFELAPDGTVGGVKIIGGPQHYHRTN
jgi:hypothetical protein